MQRRREPEVGDHHPTVVAHQDVVGLDVAVHDPGVVQRREAVGGVDEDTDDLTPRRRMVPPRAQTRTLDELHRDEHRVVIDAADVEHRQYVGVLDPSERLGLAEGPLAAHPITLVAVPEHLERDVPAQSRVVRRVHRRARPAPEHVEQHIATQASSRWFLRCRLGA
jgi:hypothetical protein